MELPVVPGRASDVILASNPEFKAVTVAGAFVTVAVTAVPLELMVIMVWPALFVVIAIYVAAEPLPTVVERPGVSVSVAGPRVIKSPSDTVGCAPGKAVKPGFDPVVPCCICCGPALPGADCVLSPGADVAGAGLEGWEPGFAMCEIMSVNRSLPDGY